MLYADGLDTVMPFNPFRHTSVLPVRNLRTAGYNTRSAGRVLRIIHLPSGQIYEVISRNSHSDLQIRFRSMAAGIPGNTKTPRRP